METIFTALAIVTVLASLIKLVKKDAWWIRFFDFPQVQLVVIGFIAFIGLLFSWDLSVLTRDILLAMLLAILVYQSVIIFPYTFLARTESRKIHGASDEDQLSFMIANVYMYNRDYGKCLELIKDRNPDLLLMVETDHGWEKAMREIEGLFKYNVKYPLDNTYGILLYSKLELINPEVKFLVESDVPSIHTHIQLRNGKVTRLYALHPKPPSPTENDTSTERDAELYLVAKEIQHVKTPVIVAGDLNDVAWSHSTRMFQRISRMLDPRKGRGFFNTFHAGYPIFRWPLDHIFHSSEFGLADIKRLPDIGSDHFPMFIELIYIREGRKEEPMVEPVDEEDIEEANEKIRAAL
ncbi:endonuclease/exonuclease/phosphatase family protein [Fulvivirga ulvae]|uniref:endonuclease/exonuclease/phosphatase family protein n=1 Tax=Fulvivirga ulvae TaxID=2904245 RepID=UPI001F254669|nr:endonuclease/exonuclease/phosphatase family protein [Fulvivirga ulvae]UII30284.1 endonuclease/exonuclease/phosphatase family protein [Fulvivirga ulvae]